MKNNSREWIIKLDNPFFTLDIRNVWVANSFVLLAHPFVSLDIQFVVADISNVSLDNLFFVGNMKNRLERIISIYDLQIKIQSNTKILILVEKKFSN